ncbi:MAG: glycosyltransferase [Gammaproteobacteria bacterium]|nr:glycosyltransferase [Gammaproteobacteria bacterium]
MTKEDLISKPTVSVVMPVYNVRAYIEQAVSSVLSQTYEDYELLIIDDESPDDSIAFVEGRFSDSRIKIIRQKNRGLAGARNTGIRSALGTFVAFLDSDDFWQINKLEKHIELMEGRADIGVSFSASMFVNQGSNPIDQIQSPYIKKDYTARNVFCRNPIGNGSAPVIRKGILDQIAFVGRDKHGQRKDYWQYFDESLKQSEDVDCWSRIAVITATNFFLIDEPLTNYRVNNEGLSADVENQFKTWRKFVAKLAVLAPDFVLENGSAATAFQCRYAARRCLTQSEGKLAAKWMWRAIKTDLVALFEEPKRTLVTIGACALFCVIPQSWQRKIVARVVS